MMFPIPRRQQDFDIDELQDQLARCTQDLNEAQRRLAHTEQALEELKEKEKKLALSLQRIFECPVCFNTMDSTLKLCINGHGVCSSCVSKVNQCPTCQQELSSVRQNTLLGKVLENIPKPCPYTESGCSVVVLDQEHQTYCEYRPTKCYNFDCTWEGCVKDLLEHVKGCQQYKSVVETPLGVDVYRGKASISNQPLKCFTPLICEGQVFWIFRHIILYLQDGITRRISHKVYYAPTFKPTCYYYMVVSFKTNEIEFTHTCRASTDITNHSESVQSGVTMPYFYISELVREDGYSHTIKLIRK